MPTLPAARWRGWWDARCAEVQPCQRAETAARPGSVRVLGAPRRTTAAPSPLARCDGRRPPPCGRHCRGRRDGRPVGGMRHAGHREKSARGGGLAAGAAAMAAGAEGASRGGTHLDRSCTEADRPPALIALLLPRPARRASAVRVLIIPVWAQQQGKREREVSERDPSRPRRARASAPPSPLPRSGCGRR